MINRLKIINLSLLKENLNRFFRFKREKIWWEFLILILLAIPLPILVFEVTNPAKKIMISEAELGQGVLVFSSETYNLLPNQEFMVNLFLKTGGEIVSAVDAQVIYDPALLEFVSATQGNISEFPHYPSLGVVTDEGTKKLVAVSAVNFDRQSQSFTQGYQSSDLGLFSRLTFRALTLGTTTLTFKYTPGLTTDSNVVKKSGAEDILGTVNQVNVTIAEPTPTPEPTQVEPSPTTKPALSPTSSPDPCGNCWKGECDGRCHPQKEGPSCPDCQQ